MSIERKARISIVVSVALLAVCAVLFWAIVKTVIFAATIAVVVVPIERKVESRLWPGGARSWHKTLVSSVATLVALLALAGFVFATIMIIVVNFDMLRDFSLQVLSLVQDSLGQLLQRNIDFKQAASERLDDLFKYTQDALFTATSLLTHIIIFVSSLYVFNRHGEGVVEAVRRLIPDEHSEMIGRFNRAGYSSLYAIYVVHLGTAVLTFILALPFFWLIGFHENLMFWSLLCGIFQLIPIIGPSLIMFSIAGYAFATGDTTNGILLLAVGYPVVSAFPDIVFRPLMMGREMKLNPLILILGFFGGIMSMGLIGFAIGPLLLKILIESFKVSSDLILKNNRDETSLAVDTGEE